MALTKSDQQAIAAALKSVKNDVDERAEVAKKTVNEVAHVMASIMALRYDNFNPKQFVELVEEKEDES